jgi:protein-disulfide isomerase
VPVKRFRRGWSKENTVHRIIRGALVGSVLLVALVACAQPSQEENSSENQVAARFGDTVITVDEVEAKAGGQLIGLYQQVYQVKDKTLRSMIYDTLVEQAAAAEGLSREDYLNREIVEKIPAPSEEQIQQILNQYKAQLPPDETQARQQVTAYLKQQAGQQVEANLMTRLFDAAGVEILLDPPRVKPVVEARNPTQGPANAPVVMIEYTDFQCPYCERAQATIVAVRERYGDSVVHVFKNLPLPMHPQAALAAEAALCAADQGKFWELHDWLFANKSNISKDTLKAEAEALSLDVPAFTECIDSGAHKADVEADAAEAASFGIRGTPGFVINGRILTGAQPPDAFFAVIDDELERQGLPIPGAEEVEEVEVVDEQS